VNTRLSFARTAADTAVAVSRRCTHQGCTVNVPASATGQLTCPCHGSVFSTAGAVVSPPAQSPLASYPASIDTGTNEVVVVVS